MRPLPHYVIAIACLVGAVTIFQIGVADGFGVSPEVGVEEDVRGMEESVESFSADDRGADSIIGLAISSVNLLTSTLGMVINMPGLLTNLGIPAGLAWAVSVPIYAVAIFGIIGILRGMNIL